MVTQNKNNGGKASADLITDGTYVARPLAAGLSSTKDGNPTLGIRCVIVGGPFDGRTAVCWCNFTGASWKRSAEMMLLCGWDGVDPRRVVVDRSREVEVVIETDTDLNGKPRSRIAWINELFRIAPERQLDARTAAEFAEWLRGEMQREGMLPRAASAPSRSSGGDEPSGADAGIPAGL